MDKQFYVKRIAHYAELVTGQPVSQQNILYWYTLYDSQLKQVYEKWKELYRKEKRKR